MKLSNKEKDYISIIIVAIICAGIIWLLTGAVLYVRSLFAQDLQSDINKYFAEEKCKQEMRYLAMRDYIENMSEEEYIETFYKEQQNEI